MLATGGTIVELLDRLREQRVPKVTIACTHGLFTRNSLERFSSIPELTELVTTDSVPLATENPPLKLTTLSIAPLMAEAIRRIHLGESVSSLFTTPDWIKSSSAEPD